VSDANGHAEPPPHSCSSDSVRGVQEFDSVHPLSALERS
jgi:hypothetical protein